MYEFALLYFSEIIPASIPIDIPRAIAVAVKTTIPVEVPNQPKKVLLLLVPALLLLL